MMKINSNIKHIKVGGKVVPMKKENDYSLDNNRKSTEKESDYDANDNQTIVDKEDKEIDHDVNDNQVIVDKEDKEIDYDANDNQINIENEINYDINNNQESVEKEINYNISTLKAHELQRLNSYLRNKDLENWVYQKEIAENHFSEAISFQEIDVAIYRLQYVEAQIEKVVKEQKTRHAENYNNYTKEHTEKPIAHFISNAV